MSIAAGVLVDQQWQCRRNPSHTRQRAGGRGCYECHIVANRERAARYRELNRRIARIAADPDVSFEDVKVTPAARAYLAAFDAYITAVRAGVVSDVRDAEHVKAMALERLTDMERPECRSATPSRSSCTG